MSFQIETAKRSQAKLRIGLAAPAGGGKTYSALKLAYGLTGDWNKIGIVDTEQGSGALYSHLGSYKIIRFEPPFSADRYIEAIKAFEQAGMDVIIIDSVTHVWKGRGGLLEYQNSLGGRFQDWAKVTPLYQRFIDSILQSKAHIITTIRKKESYAMSNEDGRSKVIKQGLDDEIRDGFTYELTLAFDININHLAEPSKDRTELFMKPDGTNTSMKITEETGRMLRIWAETGEVQSVKQAIPDPTDAWEVAKEVKKEEPLKMPKTDLINDFQIKRIKELGNELGYTEADSLNKTIQYFKVKSIGDVTREQAGSFITALMNKVKSKKSEEVVVLQDNELF